MLGAILVSFAGSLFVAVRPIEIPVPVVMDFDTQEGMPVSYVARRTWWEADGVRKSAAQICPLTGDEFRVEAHDVDPRKIVRLLINGRVYQFEMSDDWSWYDSRPACDVLNAIIEHQKSGDRFFVFK